MASHEHEGGVEAHVGRTVDALVNLVRRMVSKDWAGVGTWSVTSMGVGMSPFHSLVAPTHRAPG